VSEGSTPSFALRFFLGIAFAATGLFTILTALDVSPFRASNIHGPPWIGVALGAAFASAALVLWFQDAALRRPWLSSAFGLLIIGAMASLANWIAFGPGTRECSGRRGQRAAGDARQDRRYAHRARAGTALPRLPRGQARAPGARWCWARLRA